MLVINNGYGKSGTTWIQRGLNFYFNFRAFDQRYQNPKLANKSVDPEQILTFLANEPIERHDFYSKSHWAASMPIEGGRLAQALGTMPNAVVINSVRNIGDSTISWYHHQRRDGETRQFPDWFWDVGTRFVNGYFKHHMSWAKATRPPFLFSYEQMKRGPSASFRAFMETVGREDDRSADEFDRHMDFAVSKSESNSRHMRKGIVGDWLNYFDDEMVDHVEARAKHRKFLDTCGTYFETYGVDPSELLLESSRPSQSPARS